MKPIKIFKVGTHVSNTGISLNYTKDMLADCVAAYSSEVHEAPLVIGHPKVADPSYGWVDHLELSDDGYLLAYPTQVDAEFSENVNAGKYKKISSSFYLPDAENNPTKGKLYLRHVGFLGAEVPAVKGLGSVQFAEDEDGTVEFSNWGYSLAADLFRKWRDWLIDTEGQEKADEICPNYMIESLREYANANISDVQAAFSELISVHEFQDNVSDTKVETKTAREIELEQQLAQANSTLAEKKVQEQQSISADFAESLITSGQLAPKLKAKTISLLTAAQTTEHIVEFSENEKVPLFDAFKELLSALPKIIDFSEHDNKRVVDPTITNEKNPLVADAETRAAK